MIAIAQFIAISFYLGAAAFAAVPFARPVAGARTGVLAALAAGVTAHIVALLAFGLSAGAVPMTGLGPVALLRRPHSGRDAARRRVPGTRRQPDARRRASGGDSDASAPTSSASTPGPRAGRRARGVALRAHRPELRRHLGVCDGRGGRLDVPPAAARAEVAAFRRRFSDFSRRSRRSIVSITWRRSPGGSDSRSASFSPRRTRSRTMS